MKKFLLFHVVVVVLFLAIQLVPVTRDNPPEPAPLAAPAPVMSVVNASCADCHSNRTRWPWYSRIAPVSWLVAHDVKEARDHLNLSSWGNFPPEKQARVPDEMLEHIEKGEMPPIIYIWAHSEARLDDRDRAVMGEWATAAQTQPRPIAEPATTKGSKADAEN